MPRRQNAQDGTDNGCFCLRLVENLSGWLAGQRSGDAHARWSTFSYCCGLPVAYFAQGHGRGGNPGSPAAINVLRRYSPEEICFSGASTDWCLLGCIASLPVFEALAIVRLDVVRCARLGFDRSGVGNPDGAAGRPSVPLEISRLIGT
jgi:hypothetical protein